MRNVSLSNTDEKVPDKTAKTHCEANFEPVKPTRKVVQYRIVKICLWDCMWSWGILFKKDDYKHLKTIQKKALK